MDIERKFTEKFINCYKRYPALYDKNDPLYTDKQEKKEGYRELLKIYKEVKKDANIDLVKKKINILRSSYRRALRKVERSKKCLDESDGNLYQPTLWWFDMMSFLEDLEYPKCQNSVERCESRTNSELVGKIKLGNKHIKKKKVNKESQTKIEPDSEHETEPEPETDPIAFIQSMETSREANDDDLLARTWSSQYSELPREQKVMARKIISDVLFYGCLGSLNIGAVQRIQHILNRTTEELNTIQSLLNAEDMANASSGSNISISQYHHN